MSIERRNPYDSFREGAHNFFETHLERIGLSEAQIKDQDVPSLEDSLVRIDDALRNPESFGVLNLRITADAGVVIARSNAEAQLQIGAVPISLERKKLVSERLRSIRSQRPIQTLAELIESVSDSSLRENLRTELNAARQAGPAARSQKSIQSGTAFIAMAMDPNDPSLEDVLDAIKEGSSRCGITAERIDEAGSNEPITGRMLSAIEEAEFVVVDLTNARPNVFMKRGTHKVWAKHPSTSPESKPLYRLM